MGLQCSKIVKSKEIFPLQEAMYNYKRNQVSPYDPTNLEIHYILRPQDDLISSFAQSFEKTISLDDIVHFIDEENTVNYVDFDCGGTFYS